MSPFRPDLVDVWIFRVRTPGPTPSSGLLPGRFGSTPEDGSGGLAGAAAPGSATSARGVVPGSATPASSAATAADLEILLLRRSPGRILPGLWQCVSGSLESDERPTAGALRELREETGFDAAEIAGLFDLDQVNQFHEPSYRAIVTSAVFAVRVGAAAEPVLSHEHDEMRWVSPAEALGLVIWPAYRESIRRIDENLIDPDRAIWFELTLEGDRARR